MASQTRTIESRAGNQEQLASLRNQALIKMDSGPLLSPSRIINRFNAIRKQARIGLERQGSPTTIDGGLLAIPTGNENPAEVWKDVQPGDSSLTYVLDAGSTNWKIFRAEKQVDGTITAEHKSTTVYPDDEIREITVGEFIDNMVKPLVDAYKEKAAEGIPDGPINVAIKFGFPHKNEENDGRTDAIIIDVKEDGVYSKGWKFTDWDPSKKVNVTKIIGDKLREQGVDVASIVAKNDTNAVSRDENATQNALIQRQKEIENINMLEKLNPNQMTSLARLLIEKRIKYSKAGKEIPVGEDKLPELVVLDAGFVAGGGTNGAAKGGINLEIGRAKYSFDDYQEADGEVHRKMQEMGLVKGDKHAEQETGAIIVSRVAATLALLDEKKLLDGGTNYAMQLLQTAKKDQTIVDKIAFGTPPDELAFNDDNQELIRDLAQGEMLRAGVNYGILIANVIAASLPEQGADPNLQYGLRVEGSTLLKGTGMKEVASEVAQQLLGLTYAPELIEADGNLGVAAQAMSKKHFVTAA